MAMFIGHKITVAFRKSIDYKVIDVRRDFCVLDLKMVCILQVFLDSHFQKVEI